MRITTLHYRTTCRAFAAACAGLALAACGMGGHGSLAAGNNYQAEGKYRAASIEAKKVLQHDQKNGGAWLLLGKSTLMLGNPKDAIADIEKAKANGVAADDWAVPMGRALRASRQYKKLLDTLPSSASSTPGVAARVAVLRGEALRETNQPVQARKAYEEALKLEPRNAPALIGLARLAAASKDPDAVRENVQKALTIAPDSPEVWAGKADLALANGNLADAETDYRKALDLPDDGWLPQDRFVARLKLADIQMQRKQFDKALANIRKLEKLAPQQPQPHYLHAMVLYRQGHLDEAVAQLQEVLKASPENIPAQLLMGAINYTKGNYGQTEMYLSNVMGMDRRNATARKLLAVTYYREGRSAQALDTLRPMAPKTVSDTALLAYLQKAAAYDDDPSHPAGGVDDAGAMPDMTAMTKESGHADDGRFAAVRRALARGHADKAIDLLKAMPKGDASMEARRATLLVMAYVRDKKADAAVETAAAHAKANPRDSAAQLLYGTALVADHQYGKARARYEQARKLDAGNVAALLNLGSLDVHEHHYDKAEQHFREALQNQPDNAVALTALGRLAVLRHDRDDAVKWFTKATKVAPKSAEGYIRLIMLYSRDGQFDKAAGVARKLAAAAPDNPVTLNALGAAMLNADHPDAALKPLQKAVKLAPGEALYRFNLARAQIALKDIKSAESNLQEVVGAHPEDVPAVRLLTAIKLHDHDKPAAMALAKSLQGRASTAVAGYMLQGDVYMTEKDYRKAAEVYARGLKKHDSRALVIKRFIALRAAGVDDPDKSVRDWLHEHADDDAVRMLLAGYYMGTSKHAQAAQLYERVLKDYPSNLAALNNLAWLYVEQGNPQGLALAARAYKLSPGSPSIADTYGWALMKADRSRDALPILEKAAKAAPKDPTIHYHLAMAQSRSGNRDGARATLAALRKLDAPFPERLAAEKLYRKLDGATASRAAN